MATPHFLVVTVDNDFAAMQAHLVLGLVGIPTSTTPDTRGFTVAADDAEDTFKVLAGVAGVLSITGGPVR